MSSEHTLQHILVQELLIEENFSIIYRLYISLKFLIFHKEVFLGWRSKTFIYILQLESVKFT